jgi:hypothetical protein
MCPISWKAARNILAWIVSSARIAAPSVATYAGRGKKAMEEGAPVENWRRHRHE